MTEMAPDTRSHRSIKVALIVSWFALAPGLALAGRDDGAEIEGRWETTKKDLVLDIGRCAQGYCGQVVKADNQCGRTVLTVAVSREPSQVPELVFNGDFAPPNGIHPKYRVRVSVTTVAGAIPASMVILGDEVDPSPFRRTFPYRALLARTGNAICQPGATS